MADLTIGEVGITLQATLNSVNESVSPATSTPLNLTGATVTLFWTIQNQQTPASAPVNPSGVTMTIVNATAGIVSYTFQSGDLALPTGLVNFAQFRYAIQITFPGGNTFWTSENGLLTIKNQGSLLL
jgi:hypothetical protein